MSIRTPGCRIAVASTISSNLSVTSSDKLIQILKESSAEMKWNEYMHERFQIDLMVTYARLKSWAVPPSRWWNGWDLPDEWTSLKRPTKPWVTDRTVKKNFLFSIEIQMELDENYIPPASYWTWCSAPNQSLPLLYKTTKMSQDELNTTGSQNKQLHPHWYLASTTALFSRLTLYRPPLRKDWISCSVASEPDKEQYTQGQFHFAGH